MTLVTSSMTFDGMIRKLNDHEAARAAGFPAGDGSYRRIEMLEKIARTLFERWRRPVVITRGDRGSVVFDGRELHAVPGLHLTRRIDTVGAGDSVFAGIAAALAGRLDLPSALFFASIVAGVTIQKLFQTGTASEGGDPRARGRRRISNRSGACRIARTGHVLEEQRVRDYSVYWESRHPVCDFRP